MNRIILKKPLKSTVGVKEEVIGWEVLASEEPLPKEEKTEFKADNIPIKNVNIKPIPHKTTAKILPRYKEKFGRTYDLSLHPKYPTNIPPKNTENTTVNKI